MKQNQKYLNNLKEGRKRGKEKQRTDNTNEKQNRDNRLNTYHIKNYIKYKLSKGTN